MFFDRYVALCRAKGVSPSRAAADVGLSNSVTTKWKRWDKPSQLPDSTTAGKLATYFGVSVDEILGIVMPAEEEQEELFGIFSRACDDSQISYEVAQEEAKVSNKDNIIESLRAGSMPRVSMDDIFAIADVLDCCAEVEEFLDKIKKPTAIESDELLRQTDEVKELLKKIAPEQRESVLQMLRTFAAKK